MENSTIEKFIEENLHRYLELGVGRSKQSVDKLRELLNLLSEDNIFKIEEILSNSGSLKTNILTVVLCSVYAKDILKQERLAELLNSISQGLKNSTPFSLDWF